MHRVAVIRVEHRGCVGESGGIADRGDGGGDLLRCYARRAELEDDLTVADVDPRIAPAGIVGGVAFGVFGAQFSVIVFGSKLGRPISPLYLPTPRMTMPSSSTATVCSLT